MTFQRYFENKLIFPCVDADYRVPTETHQHAHASSGGCVNVLLEGNHDYQVREECHFLQRSKNYYT